MKEMRHRFVSSRHLDFAALVEEQNTRKRTRSNESKKRQKKDKKKEKKEEKDEPSEYSGAKIFHGEATDRQIENDEEDVERPDVERPAPQTKKQKPLNKAHELKYHFTSDAAFDKYVDAYKKGLERMSAGQNTVYQKFKLDWLDCDFKKDVLTTMKNNEGAWTYDKDGVVVGLRRGEMLT